MKSFAIGCGFALLLTTATSADMQEKSVPTADADGQGGHIYQLTNIPESPFTGSYDWYALYYHDSDTTITDYRNPGPGQKVILRRTGTTNDFDKKGSADSLVYFSLDLDSGVLSPVTQEGLTNSAQVVGPWLYVAERDLISQRYFKLARYNLLHKNERQYLGIYPALATDIKLHMSISTVSDDHRYLIWTENNGVYYLKDIEKLRPEDPGTPIDVSSMLDSKNGTNIEHFQFLKGTNGARYTCVDQTPQARGSLQRVGVGRADIAHPTCGPLRSNQDRLSHVSFFHPFTDLQGHLWLDAARWNANHGLDLLSLVRLDRWSKDGEITKATFFDADSTPFQVHFNFTNKPDWLLGDGATVVGKVGGPLTGGMDAIYLIGLSDRRLNSTVLARRASNVDAIDGNLQPNAHVTRWKHTWGAIWTEWRSLVPGQKPTQNVFFVPAPELN